MTRGKEGFMEFQGVHIRRVLSRALVICGDVRSLKP